MTAAPALSPDEINARMLERAAQDAIARRNVNGVDAFATPFDLAWSGLLDLVELRARKMFPNRFDQTTEGVAPHVSVSDRSC